MHQSGREQNFKMSYFSLNNVGMPYPGLPVDLKLHLWHTICRPILTFRLETVYLNRAMYGKLGSLADGSWYETIKFMFESLIFLVNPPVRSLCSFFMSTY